MRRRSDHLTWQQRNDELYSFVLVNNGGGSVFRVRDAYIHRDLIAENEDMLGHLTWLAENPYSPSDFDILAPVVERMNAMLDELGFGPNIPPDALHDS